MASQTYIQSLHIVNNLQMNLENYKKETLDYLEKKLPAFKVEKEGLMRMSDNLWQEYSQNFSPQELAEGRANGLL